MNPTVTIVDWKQLTPDTFTLIFEYPANGDHGPSWYEETFTPADLIGDWMTA